MSEHAQAHLNEAWYVAIDTLAEICWNDDRATSDRIAAAKVILEYVRTIGTGINESYLPDTNCLMVAHEDEEDDD